MTHKSLNTFMKSHILSDIFPHTLSSVSVVLGQHVTPLRVSFDVDEGVRGSTHFHVFLDPDMGVNPQFRARGTPCATFFVMLQKRTKGERKTCLTLSH
jgi:hypothetical protein